MTMRATITWAIIMLPALGVTAKPVGLASEIRRLETKIDKTREEIAELKQSLASVQALQSQTAHELAIKEAEFKDDFAKVISPLLNWPEVSMNSRVKTWIEREHGRFVLEAIRERLVKEPLQLIADRELNLHRAEDLKKDIEQNMKALESKQQFLSLQIEELKLLQKRSRTKKAPAASQGT